MIPPLVGVIPAGIVTQTIGWSEPSRWTESIRINIEQRVQPGSDHPESPREFLVIHWAVTRNAIVLGQHLESLHQSHHLHSTIPCGKGLKIGFSCEHRVGVGSSELVSYQLCVVKTINSNSASFQVHHHILLLMNTDYFVRHSTIIINHNPTSYLGDEIPSSSNPPIPDPWPV